METNGNSKPPGGSGFTPGLTATPQGSLESLSEYTDAHEDTASAPTEFLAEFLSAIMLKDYESALKYCKLILQYEPHNATAKELYPLIIEKIQLTAEDESGEESGGERSDGTTASYSSLEDEEVEEYDNGHFGPGARGGLASSPSEEFGNGNLGWVSREPSCQSLMTSSPSDEFGNGNCSFTSCETEPQSFQLCADKENGNSASNFVFPSSSEESSPTEPVSQNLAQPLLQLRL